jgi:hypothetical protein
MRKTLTIAGVACEITLAAEDGGYAYVARRATGVLRVEIARGWTAGTRTVALIEAREHAASTLAAKAG